jgi:hypothetical protein
MHSRRYSEPRPALQGSLEYLVTRNPNLLLRENKRYHARSTVISRYNPVRAEIITTEVLVVYHSHINECGDSTLKLDTSYSLYIFLSYLLNNRITYVV